MQNLINDAPAKRNYDFIDYIRCIAMIGIVCEHCFGLANFPLYSSKFWAYITVIQLNKSGTILFFVLAGFLISDKFTDYSPGQYLQRRFSNTFAPWLFWTIVFNVCMIITLHITDGMYHDGRFNISNILENIKITYLFTNYWFIINFMVSISLLLIFKRYLYSLFFGAVLLIFTLFYCINIHYEWINPNHTIAILGFVFFLWMGAQMRKHWAAIEKWITKLSYLWLFAALALAFGLCSVEIVSLLKQNSLDAYNTLRFSNVLFSLATFFLLLKIKNFPFLKFLNPRQTTFGIYLIHYIVLVYIKNEITRPLNIDEAHLSTLGYLLDKLMDFVIVYAITIFSVFMINKTRFKRLVGN